MAAEARSDAPSSDLPRLETPQLRAGLLAWIAAGTLLFIAVVVPALWVFFRTTVGAASPPPAHTFAVAPRLETSIDPRTWPAEQPGPAQADPPHPQIGDAAVTARAMAQTAAKGAHGYEPVAAPAIPQVQGSGR